MEKPKTITKVAKFRILKPAGAMSWKELQKLLCDVRYRAFRLANLEISDAYLGFHAWRMGQEYEQKTTGKLSRQLRKMFLDEEGCKPEQMDRFSRTGILPDTVAGALHQYKIRSVTAKSKWSQVIRGKVSLPTFRLNMSIPVRCDKPGQKRLEQTESGDVELDLMVTCKPYPRVVLQTGKIGQGQQAVLKRLLENKENADTGYRQRLFEIKQDSRTGKWWLYVTYDLPLRQRTAPDENIAVGVDLGVSVPLYAAINNGHARLGRRHFQAAGQRIRTLQRQTSARRRAIQRGGRAGLSGDTARSGHGVKRKLLPTKTLQKKIENAYSTLNHQLSASVIDFARNHNAGVIQIENLENLKEHLTGTYIGANWRYHQFQQFLKYKAEEAQIKLKKVNPIYTSRRCSKCGHIHIDFDRSFRDNKRQDGKVVRFICPECDYEADPDYNAARNIATIGIEELIREQCKKQGIEHKALSQVK